MILLYGAGGEPGRGEIPMDSIRYRASEVEYAKANGSVREVKVKEKELER